MNNHESLLEDVKKCTLTLIQNFILNKFVLERFTIEIAKSRNRRNAKGFVLAERIFWVFPCGSVSSHNDEVWQSCLFSFFLENGIEGLNGFTIRTPIGTVLVLFASD